MLLLACIETSCIIRVERKWIDLCGNRVQCPKLKPTCAPIKSFGTPSCKRFENDSILVNLYKSQHGFYKISRVKSINILDGYNGWREMKYKPKLKLKWTNEMSGRLIRILTSSQVFIIKYFGIDMTYFNKPM